MPLLDEAFEEFTIIDKTTENDGYGGYSTTWTDGASFMGALSFNNSLEAKVAMAQGVSSVYVLSTRRNIDLEYHTVFRRKSDQMVFRVTSDGTDNKTPLSASPVMDIRQVSVEEWRLD